MINDEIDAAHDVTKTNTYRMETFVVRDLRPLGYGDSDRIVFYRTPIYLHTAESEFDISALKTLPRVDVTYAYQYRMKSPSMRSSRSVPRVSWA